MSAKKVAKLIAFTAQANDSHNAIKIKNVLRWLKLGHEVRVQINGKVDRQKSMESIYKQLERDIKSGARFLQKVVKPEVIKVTLSPTKEAAELNVENTKLSVDVDEELESITSNQDIFSGEFEKELENSIRQEYSKNKKR